MTANPYDAKKEKENRSKHGIGFDAIEHFEWETAITVEDSRFNYGEPRYISYGFIDTRLYVLVWTPRDKVRPISLRKANRKERKRYEEAS